MRAIALWLYRLFVPTNRQPGFISCWQGDLFSPGLDVNWACWVDDIIENAPEDKRRDELTDLLDDPRVRFGSRARALIILLCPDLTWAPIYWKVAKDGQRQPSFLGSHRHTRPIERLCESGYPSEERELLLHLACDVIVHYVQQLSKRSDPTSLDRLYDYLPIMRELLGHLPEEAAWADELFQVYPLNDPESYWSVDDASGYNPYDELLNDREIPEKWKWEADRRMRTIVEQELGGQLVPRAEHERASRRYMIYLTDRLWRSTPSYSTELFGKQIRFVESLEGQLLLPQEQATYHYLMTTAIPRARWLPKT